MRDILPFIRLTSKTPEGQISEIVFYLNQIKEDLEYILTNISMENLSPDIRERLDMISKYHGIGEEELAQLNKKE